MKLRVIYPKLPPASNCGIKVYSTLWFRTLDTITVLDGTLIGMTNIGIQLYRFTFKPFILVNVHDSPCKKELNNTLYAPLVKIETLRM